MNDPALETHAALELDRLITLLRVSGTNWAKCAELICDPPGLSAVFAEIARNRTEQADALEADLGDQLAAIPRGATGGAAVDAWREVSAALAQGAPGEEVAAAAERAERQLHAKLLAALNTYSATSQSPILWGILARIQADAQNLRRYTPADPGFVPERRGEERFPANLGVNVWTPDLGLSSGRTLDLSAHGMKLEVLRPLPVGADVTISLALEDHTIGIACRIRSSQPAGPGVFVHGVEFITMDRIDRERLNAFLLGCRVADPEPACA